MGTTTVDYSSAPPWWRQLLARESARPVPSGRAPVTTSPSSIGSLTRSDAYTRSMVLYQQIDRLEEGNSPRKASATFHDQQMKTRPRRAWWWEAGPVKECGFGIGLRSGMWLLALSAFLNAYVTVTRTSLTVLNLEQFIDHQKAKYELGCEGRIASYRYCRDLSGVIDEGQTLLDWVAASAPLLYSVGVINLFFGVVGVVAASTRGANMARAFMYYCPMNVAFVAFLVTCLPGGLTHGDCLGLCLSLYVLVYGSKVTWSFYVRHEVTETRLAASVALLPRDGVKLQATQSAAITY